MNIEKAVFASFIGILGVALLFWVYILVTHPVLWISTHAVAGGILIAACWNWTSLDA